MKKKKLILIGASTGGPGHLEKILHSLDSNFSGTMIIAQHIDSIFLPSMIKHLNNLCPVKVIQAHENTPVEDGCVIFAHKKITDLHIHNMKGLFLRQSVQSSHYSPSVNALFSSASKLHMHYDTLACLLTGIGDDGAQGLLELKNSGAYCIAESEDTSIVYGMPKAAAEIGASCKSLPLDQIISEINNF